MLPKAVTAVGIVPWQDFSPELKTSAAQCADGVAAAVSAGVFWPPTELPVRDAAWDDFAELFHRGAAASVRFAARNSGTNAMIAALGALAAERKEEPA